MSISINETTTDLPEFRLSNPSSSSSNAITSAPVTCFKASASHFTIHSSTSYKPNCFTEESECPLVSVEFRELVEAHFQNVITPYFVALLEDTGKGSALCDLEEFKRRCAIKKWSSSECFRNPKSRQMCERIHILGIDKFGDISRYSTCTSIEQLKHFAQVSSLKSLYINERGESIVGVPNVIDSFLRNLNDEEVLNWMKLIAEYKELADTHPSGIRSCIYYFVLQRENRGDTKHAVRAIDMLDNKFRENPRVQRALAAFFYRKNTSSYGYYNSYDPIRAQKHCEKAMQLYLHQPSSDVIECMLILSDLYRKLGKYEEAEALCNEVIRHSAHASDKRSAYEMLVDIFLETGRQIEAIAILQKLSDGRRPFVGRTVRLGEAYKVLGDFEEAEKHLNTVVNGTDYCQGQFLSRGYVSLAEIARIRGNFLEAYCHLDSAMKYLSNSFDTDADSALIESQRKQVQTAEELALRLEFK